MGSEFGMNGFNINGSFSSPMSCVVENGEIYQVSFNGRQKIGVTQQAYDELMQIANEYKNVLIEKGIIEKEKTPEEIQLENQQMMANMLEIINNLSNEVKELKENAIKYPRTDTNGGENDGGKSKQTKPSGGKSSTVSE